MAAARDKDVRVDGPRVHVKSVRPWRGLRRGALINAALVTLARAAPAVRGDITVVLTNDRAIRALNRKYRGHDRPTDVLSFDIGDGLDAAEPFGDVVISVETARRQAREYDAPLETEVVRLLVHGTLHLCGYDHHERREAAKMHGLTRRLVSALTAS
ncbi:MAG TPA: rRNA maturation RNase YbeY [Candidatus Eremiobacteraceae bacterium]